ncbi:MAG: YdeI/OmpD-associated family protein [Pseudomonadota bacterium]
MADPTFFSTAADFRRWLASHAAAATELLVGFHKVGSGLPSMSWSESVDEALCFGWIDGVRRRIDDARYSIRFTPRQPGSIWSAINIAKIERLQAEGRMTPVGIAAFERRIDERSKVYSYEQDAPAELSPAEVRAFKRNRAAWRYFENAPPGYRQQMLHRICNAKRLETRAARLDKLIAASAAGQRLA